MSSDTRRRRRKRHHVKQHQSPLRRRRRQSWMCTTALVASTALSAGFSTRVLASTMPVPSETAKWVQQAQGNSKAGDQPVQRFDIVPGPLSAVLPVFEKAAGIKVTLAVDSIGMITSPGVSGVFTPQDALVRLLDGTNVAVRFTAPGAATLEFRLTAESVDVTAPAPRAIVSSPKYTKPLRDIPQTIDVIPQSVMAVQGVRTLSEALRNVPGITMQAGEGGGSSNTSGDMFNMRGFNAANSIFVDGVRDDGLVSRDVFNLEQVEVFLGPTGSDVGRGTAAGYVNMATKAPHLGAGYSAQVGYGSSDQMRATADFNAPLPAGQNDGWVGKAGFRLNVLWQDSGVPGRDIVEQKSRALAPSLALGLGTATRVTLGAQILRQDNVPDYGVPGAAWSEAPLTPTTVQAPLPVAQSNYFGSVGYDYDNASQDSYLGRVEHDINANLTFRNQTRYNQTYRDAVITSIAAVAAYDPKTSLVTLSRQGNQRENTIVSNQTSLVDNFATGALRHSASVGLEYTFEQQFAPVVAGVGTRAPVSIYTPNPNDPVAGYNVVRTGASSKGWTNTLAAYAFDSVDLGRKWQASGGLRFERYDTQFRAVDATSITTTNQGADDALWSGKAGLVYRAAANGNLYVSYGTSVTPPGAANFTLSAQANNQNNPNVKPQTSTNYEAGAKWDFAGGLLSINGSVFHTRNANVIFTTDPTAVPPVFNQDDGQRVNGVAVGASGRVNQQWQILGSFTYLDSTLESQSPLTNGNRLTLTPKRSASLWTTYRLPARVTLGGGLRATDEVFINAANNIVSPGYCVVDSLAEYEVNSHLSLRLNIYNLGNATYIRNVNNNGARYNPGNPRSAMLTSALKF